MDDRSGYPKRNGEGYNVPTPHQALSGMQRETDMIDIRHHRIIVTVRNMIDLAGFDCLNRIELRDKESGRTYR